MSSTSSIRSIIICFLTCKDSFSKVLIPPSLCSFLQLRLLPHGLVPTVHGSTSAFPGRLQQPWPCMEVSCAQLARQNGPQMFEEYTANIPPADNTGSKYQEVNWYVWNSSVPAAWLGEGREGRSTCFVCTFGSLVPTCSLRFPHCLSSKEH